MYVDLISMASYLLHKKIFNYIQQYEFLRKRKITCHVLELCVLEGKRFLIKSASPCPTKRGFFKQFARKKTDVVDE